MAEVDVKLPELGEDAGDEARVSFWYMERVKRSKRATTSSRC